MQLSKNNNPDPPVPDFQGEATPLHLRNTPGRLRRYSEGAMKREDNTWLLRRVCFLHMQVSCCFPRNECRGVGDKSLDAWEGL